MKILSVADGIMVARGDMGVEIDYADSFIQKHLIDHAMQMGKLHHGNPDAGFYDCESASDPCRDYRRCQRDL